MDWNFGTVFESVADAIPDHTALVQGDRRRTWREFDERAARLAAALRDRGLAPGSKVAFYLYNSQRVPRDALRLLQAAGRPRQRELPLHRRRARVPARQLRRRGAGVPRFARGAGGRGARPAASKVRAAVQVDDGSPLVDGALRYEDLIEAHDPMERIERSGDDLVFLYTGGTTGMPKAVVWRHEDLFGALAPAGVRVLRPRDARAGCRGGVLGRARSTSRAWCRCTCRRPRSCTGPVSSRRSRRCSWAGRS